MTRMAQKESEKKSHLASLPASSITSSCRDPWELERFVLTRSVFELLYVLRGKINYFPSLYRYLTSYVSTVVNDITYRSNCITDTMLYS